MVLILTELQQYMLYCAQGEHMARGRSSEDLTTLQMALIGYQLERQRIEEKISELRRQLSGSKGAARPADGARTTARAKRVLSAAARKRIAAAQKKRWAEHRKKQAVAAKAE
jgi:hypothetical protein